MPCDSSYMDANTLEIECSRMTLLLRELETGVPVDPHSSDWHGYMPGIYCGLGASRQYADKLAAALCERLKATPDVTRYSLELQMWWREHQRADAERKALNIKEDRTNG